MLLVVLKIELSVSAAIGVPNNAHTVPTPTTTHHCFSGLKVRKAKECTWEFPLHKEEQSVREEFGLHAIKS